MCGTETSNYLKKFLNTNNLESNKKANEGIQKIFLSKQTEEFKNIAKNILNEEIKIEKWMIIQKSGKTNNNSLALFVALWYIYRIQTNSTKIKRLKTNKHLGDNMINGENASNIRMNIKIQENSSVNIYRICKRAIDIISAIIGIIILCPLMAIVFIANRIEGDKGPLFFMQKRIGENGKLFRLYKFRTMVVDADKILMKKMKTDKEFREKYLNYRKIENDERITKIGKFLRKTSLDEFPQFINVLKGEMSLVRA